MCRVATVYPTSIMALPRDAHTSLRHTYISTRIYVRYISSRVTLDACSAREQDRRILTAPEIYVE